MIVFLVDFIYVLVFRLIDNIFSYFWFKVIWLMVWVFWFVEGFWYDKEVRFMYLLFFNYVGCECIYQISIINFIYFVCVVYGKC